MNAQMTNFKADSLTDADLRHQAPSIFAAAPLSGLSARYTFVPTTDIVNGLREKQWLPVHVEQQRPRAATRFGFQKHLIRFRRAEQMRTLDEWNAELVLTNSHDAGCAYVLQVGIFRRLCSNGLVVADEHFEAIRFRHAGLKTDEVVQASYRVLESIPRVSALIDRFRNHQLDGPGATNFAHKALLLRYDNLDESPIDAQTLLTARRPEDQASDLWTTFNKVQENLVRGGLGAGRRDRNGRLRTIRSLRGLDSKVSLNQALWRLAEQTASANN